MLESVTPTKGTPVPGRDVVREMRLIDGVEYWLKGSSPSISNDCSPYHERAAYLVSEVLGFHIVPYTALTLLDGYLVSAQLYINNAVKPTYKDYHTPKLKVFDYIINNIDRHSGNWFKRGKSVWAIDNAMSFSANDNDWWDRSKAHKLTKRMKKNLMCADTNRLMAVLDGLITPEQISYLLLRLNNVIKLIKESVMPTTKEIIEEARNAGREAAAKKLAELQEAGDRWVVKNGDGREVGRMLDVCGRANIYIVNRRKKFWRDLLKLDEEPNSRVFVARSGGWMDIFDMTNRQEVSVHRAAGSAVVEVFKKYGIEAYVSEWID